MRKDLLRAYLLTLLAEGQFSSAHYSELLSRATALLSQDLASLIPEIGAMVGRQLAERGVKRASDAVIGAMSRVVKRASEKGWGGIWREMQAAYDRGTDAQRKRR